MLCLEMHGRIMQVLKQQFASEIPPVHEFLHGEAHVWLKLMTMYLLQLSTHHFACNLVNSPSATYSVIPQLFSLTLADWLMLVITKNNTEAEEQFYL